MSPDGSCVGLVPRSRVLLSARSATHVSEHVEIAPDTRYSEVMLPMRLVRRLHLRFEHGGAPLVPDERWRVRAHRFDRPANVVAERRDANEIVLDVDDGGRWIVWVDGEGAPGALVTLDVLDGLDARATIVVN